MKCICGIYAISGPGDKTYIGASIDIHKRWDQHKYQLNLGNHHCIQLQRAWNKYDENFFTFSILGECQQSDLQVTEQYWIDRTPSNLLYNSLRVSYKRAISFGHRLHQRWRMKRRRGNKFSDSWEYLRKYENSEPSFMDQDCTMYRMTDFRPAFDFITEWYDMPHLIRTDINPIRSLNDWAYCQDNDWI